MAVREFDGVDDTIHHAIDVLSGMTFGTVAAMVKHTAGTSTKQIVGLHNSGGSGVAVPLGSNITSGDTGFYWHDLLTESRTASGTYPINTWMLCVVRKATGTATPRFSLYNLTSTTWSHANGNNALVNSTAPGAGGTVRTSFDGSEFLQGRIAVRAIWANEVHWSADTTGDTAIQAAGLHTSLQNWIDETPDALWAFNQAVTTDPVDDLIANCDQTSLTGTTVITDDDPPGFDFEPPPPSPPAPNLFLSRSLQNR